ncbi:arf-GAP with Rho-GAP domain, ANK repeat and PH domain-containing protein 1-like isoform X2 [Xenia sp. Carnegie-2017]|uniref:arf-GAP with Rho-GAP domain, ANK repeat and PH domain-containing protein 1-like isoform X2 n=1 Tax=Xenia sp. Carnegie-2017 TaxID=2897299 RepID=UPI001F04891A|nr:arf-GAP with Rho-GAP domain, ANK repeat and PH domain-containing protein 1-like isoform X2 [Xenia sp. Carnegie-2017]
MMNISTPCTRKQFDVSEWLTNDVKLPQYVNAFLQNGFELPLECSRIDEKVLNALGIDKIGHRKRLLVSCQRLAEKYGLNCSIEQHKTNDVLEKSQVKGKYNSIGFNQVNDEDIPPILPPKKGKRLKPVPTPRDMDGNVQVFDDNTTVNNSGNFSSSSPNLNSSKIGEVTIIQKSHLSNPVDKNERIRSEDPHSPGFSPEEKISSYEHLWQADEGKPPHNSSAIPFPVTTPEGQKNTLDEDNSSSLKNMPNAQYEDRKNENSTQYENISTSSGVKFAPAIPPRSDLEEDIYANVTIVTSQERKIPPCKPPRPSKPVFVTSSSSSTETSITMSRKSASSTDLVRNTTDTPTNDEVIEAVPVPNRPPSADSAFANSNQLLKVTLRPSHSETKENACNRRPQPVPRSRTLSGQNRNDENLYETIPDKVPRSSSVATGAQEFSGHLHDNGSCTEDDLSGSDEEMPDKDVSSEYEIVSLPPRTHSMIQNRHTTKEGYLYKQGGQQNNKGWKKRWVVFDGQELRYYKDKDHTDETLQVVPVAIMKEVAIVTDDAKRARFDLFCAGRTYMFARETDEWDVIQVWAQCLMGAIIQVRKQDQTNVTQPPGGNMFESDKKGYLKKQMNTVVGDFRKRYVAVKDEMFAYYHNSEDFLVASPINTIEMKFAKVKVDPRTPNRFQLITSRRTYLFQCDDENEMRQWVAALEKSIQLGLGDKTVLNKIRENPSNRRCADCGAKDPVWASVNLLVCVCENCIGVHRRLGVHVSKAKSILMDVKVWTPSLVKLFVNVGNEVSNRFWQHKLPEDDAITPNCSSEAREEFIRKKYERRLYRNVSPFYGDPDALRNELKAAVCTNDVGKTMLLVFCGADVKNEFNGGLDTETPYDFARAAGQELQMEFLLQNGAVTKEPEPANHEYASIYELPEKNDVFHDASSPSFQEKSLVPYEKEGYLYKKPPNTASVWRKRYFMLAGRELWYDKDKGEEFGLIKLKDVEDYVYNDSLTLDIITNERTYYLRAETKSEAHEWYIALRNKQVFQVSLSCQELGSDGIPHLVAKALQFVEAHGLDAEGIYRKNGNKAKIRVLRKLFNQDAETVIILREEYEAHDVAGLLKEYFRELPDPLMTEDAYAHFITASLSPVHEKKLRMYKDSLGRLPEVNRTTLKSVINHLVRVCARKEQNLMKLENVSLIFGPTLMSNEEMGSMDSATINQEFAVIADLITYYEWLFDVSHTERNKDKKIEEAMLKLNKLSSKPDLLNFSDMNLDIYPLDIKNECVGIKVYPHTTAGKLCQEIAFRRGMPPDVNWALFQNVDGEIERAFPAMEKILSTVIHTGKYSQLVKGSHLVVKENYVIPKLESFALENDKSGYISGIFATMKESKKSWKKNFVKLDGTFLTVQKNAKGGELDKWPVAETDLYIGVDRVKKPPTAMGFTIARLTTENHCCYRYICLEDERDLYRWINIFLKSKYSGVDDLWKDPDVQPTALYEEASSGQNRQSVPGFSTKVVNELKQRHSSSSSKKS